MRRRVVVTGMGMVTPLGLDLESTWEGLRQGRSGVSQITLFDASTFPTKIAAEVKGFRLLDYGPQMERWVEHSRNSQLALAAAHIGSPVRHSTLDTPVSPPARHSAIDCKISSP